MQKVTVPTASFVKPHCMLMAADATVFTHKRAAICMAELVTLYNEKLNSLFRLCYT